MTQEKARKFPWRKLIVAVIALVVVASLSGLVGFLDASDGHSRGSGKSGKSGGSSNPGHSGHPQCPGGFTVELDKNEGNRLFSEGVHAQTAEGMIRQVLHGTKQGPGLDGDPRQLQTYYNATSRGQKHPVKDAKSLVKGEWREGACYNERGRRIYRYVEQSIKTAYIKVNSQAPAGGTNTGAVPGSTTAFAHSGAIGGNRAAYEVRFVDGNVIWVLKRCGNVVTMHPIHLPPKPPPPNPPRTCEERYGPNSPRCNPSTSGGKDSAADVSHSEEAEEQGLNQCGSAGCNGTTTALSDNTASPSNYNPANSCQGNCQQEEKDSPATAAPEEDSETNSNSGDNGGKPNEENPPEDDGP